MDLIYAGVFAVCGVVLIMGWRMLVWVWLRPRKLEKLLRDEGLKGNSYKFLVGDMREMGKMMEDAKSNPISITDDIRPRCAPLEFQTIKNHGKNSFYWLGPKPVIIITDPDMLKEILAKNDQFVKGLADHPLLEMLATGLVYYEGDKWIKHRKIINPAFNADKLKNMFSGMYLSCSEIMNKLEKMVSSKGQCELDVYEYIEELTSDVISRTSFGSSYEEGRKIFLLQKEQADLLIQSYKSLLIFVPGMSILPTKLNKRMKAIAKEVKDTLRSIINKRLKAMELGGETNHDDLLGILLESNRKEIEENGNNNFFGMSIDDVIEECKLFYLAGQETTSNTLVWAMILLAQHQDWQKLGREEVLHLFGNNKPDLGGLNRLKVVNMILLEVLRLYPPVVAFTRVVNEETKLGEVTLPRGVTVQVPMLLLHHNKELWGDDASEFNPTRFSEGVAKVTQGKTKYLPFSGGPRICIGQNFAMLEAKMALSMILQRFSFVLSPSYTHAPYNVVTLQPQHGAHLVIHSLHS